MESDQNTNQESSTKENKNIAKRYLAVIWDFLKIIVIAAVIVLPIRYFIFQPFIVKGESMAPNFHSGNYLIIDEISYRFSAPSRGDVVVLKYPLDAKQRFIKRIVGLPGETVDIKNGKITISKGDTSLTLQENYLAGDSAADGDFHIVLQDDQYFVLGDNRKFSYDSRGWGALPQKYIVGKAVLRVFPLYQIAIISGVSY